jgi:hypothetical protein
MKSFVRSIGIAAGLLLLAGVSPARAQVTDSIQFTTTFPFAIGYANVPAGTYTIRPDEDDPVILRLTGTDVAVLFLTDNVEARQIPSTTEVVFKRYGDGYVLKDVWEAGSSTGAEAVTAEAEKHAAKAGAANSDYRVAALRMGQSQHR